MCCGEKKINKEVLPGLEPGSKDSESLVITNYTTRPPVLQNGLLLTECALPHERKIKLYICA